MAGWIEVYPKRIAGRLAWLHCMLRCSERQHLSFDRIDIVDRHVKVELLRPFTRRPRRRQEVIDQLERHSQPVDRQDNPVLFGGVNIPAEDTLIELGQRPGVRAIQHHGSHASKGHDQTVFHGPIDHGGMRPSNQRDQGSRSPTARCPSTDHGSSANRARIWSTSSPCSRCAV